MSALENTLATLAPGVFRHQESGGAYHPKKGLAIYFLPIPGYSPAAPVTVLGEALAARSGLGCTMQEGIPAKIPDGAVVVGQYNALKAARPDLVADLPDVRDNGAYVLRVGNYALVTSHTRDGLASGMQTMAMLVLRHGEAVIPGVTIVDKPACQARGLAVELLWSEIRINLLMQIASFAATFKANRIHLILDDCPGPGAAVPDVDMFIQTCQSSGIGVGVRLPWLGKILSGEKSLIDAWSGIRAAARLFGASHAALDDPCPPDADPLHAARIVDSMLKGEAGLAEIAADARLFLAGRADPRDLRALGVVAWRRMRGDPNPPDPDMADLPLQLDVQAPLPAFSAEPAEAFHRRLDAALAWTANQPRREIMVSFRDIGVSHMWQNLLLPAATGLIAAWNPPAEAARAAESFATLLYGDLAGTVLAAWNAASRCFPPDLGPEGETLARRTAFGFWPETDEKFALLAGIDWPAVIDRIREAAEILKTAADALTRNAATLAGVKLGLHAVSWLHCFVALAPELARRKHLGADEDGRTGPIAAELHNAFLAWHKHLVELQEESGLEFVEMPRLKAMGERLQDLCADAIGPAGSEGG